MIPFESRDGGAVRAIDSQRSSMLDDWAAVMAGDPLAGSISEDAAQSELQALVAQLVRDEFDRRAAEALLPKKGYRPTVKLCLMLVENEFGVSADCILGHDRCRPIARARQAAAWLSFQVTGLNHSEIARYLNRERSTVAHHIDLANHLRKTDSQFADKTTAALSFFKAYF